MLVKHQQLFTKMFINISNASDQLPLLWSYVKRGNKTQKAEVKNSEDNRLGVTAVAVKTKNLVKRLHCVVTMFPILSLFLNRSPFNMKNNFLLKENN